MSELTERARKLRDGITPGPWVAEIGDQIGCVRTAEEHGVCTVFVECATWDAEFIAAAPSLIRDLIEEVERLEREHDQG